MPELAEVSLKLWKLRFNADLSWGDDDDDEQEPPPIMSRPDLIEVPELDLDEEHDEIDRLGFH